MTLEQGSILAIIQGVTELLPVSSSGHLLLVSEFIKAELDISFVLFLHFATVLAIFLGYYKKYIELLLDKDRINHGLKIVIASIPAAILGLLFDDAIERIFYNPTFDAINLFFWGAIMIYTEQKYLKTRDDTNIVDDIKKISLKQAFLIGLGQPIALIPGTSRSGITTLTGIYSGLKKHTALDFSFIIGLPIIMGAFLVDLIKERSEISSMFTTNNLVFGLLAFISGYISLLILQRFKKDNFLTFFGVYRILIAIVILAIVLI